MLYAHRGHVTGALAVFDQLLVAQDHRRSVFAARGHRMVVGLGLARCQLSQRDPTGQRGAALEELPAASSFRTHQSLLRTWFFINDAATKSRPRGREYTPPCQIRPALMPAPRGKIDAAFGHSAAAARRTLAELAGWRAASVCDAKCRSEDLFNSSV